jgi:4-hydroxybenzoate polyprenyltransferase
MISLTMFLVRYCLILPTFQTTENITGEFPAHMSRLYFLLLTGATVLIAAAGNIINDVFDVTTDAINRPGKNIFENRLSKKTGKNAFYVLSSMGTLLGMWVGFAIEKPAIGMIHLFSASSLWMYSSYYKRRLLSGNFLIAFLTFLMVLLPGLFEPEYYPNIVYLFVFAVLAFMVSLAREIIKDIEDLDGDERMQCKTLPIRYGIKSAKIAATTVLIVTGGFITYIVRNGFEDNTVIAWWNLLLIFLAPLCGLIYLVVTANEKKDYHFASIFAKGFMLFGVLSIFPFWFYFLR